MCAFTILIAKEDGHFAQAASAAALKLGHSNLKEQVEVV